MELVCKSVADTIGNYGDGIVVVIVSLEGVRGLGREALTPTVASEDFVGRVKIVTVARIQSSGRVEIWFS